MKGKHIKKQHHYLIILIIFIILVGFKYLKPTKKEDLSKYNYIVGNIEKVGDEILLINSDGNKYIISIAGAIDSNKGLEVGNRIYIYYDGKLDINNKDIQNVKVKSYKVLQ